MYEVSRGRDDVDIHAPRPIGEADLALQLLQCQIDVTAESTSRGRRLRPWIAAEVDLGVQPSLRAVLPVDTLTSTSSVHLHAA